MFVQDACAGNTVLPWIQGFLWCLLSSYLDIHCLPPEALVGLIPDGLTLPRYWDFSQCWYCEGRSRLIPVAAGLLLTWAIRADGGMTAYGPCV